MTVEYFKWIWISLSQVSRYKQVSEFSELSANKKSKTTHAKLINPILYLHLRVSPVDSQSVAARINLPSRVHYFIDPQCPMPNVLFIPFCDQVVRLKNWNNAFFRDPISVQKFRFFSFLFQKCFQMFPFKVFVPKTVSEFVRVKVSCLNTFSN